MDLALLSDRDCVDFPTSYVFDPYPKLLAWLERVASGHDGQVRIDAEGWCIHLIASSLGGDSLRFTVIFEHDGEGEPHTRKMKRPVDDVIHTFELKCDVSLPRRAFVAGFYGGLQEGWETPESESFWVRWLNMAREEWGETYDVPWEAALYRMESSLIDAYLAGQRRDTPST